MKRFKDCAAQGDLLIKRIDAIPSAARPTVPLDGKYILAHSETGHHHTIVATPGVEFLETEDPTVAYLRVIDEVEALLEHERSFDQHESLLIQGGTYEIRTQREYTPEGWRRVQD